MTESQQQRRKYPSLSLEQAIQRARVLYDEEGRNAAPVDLVVQHWGFKSIKTGPASTAYSAVKQFGLIDETGSGATRKAAISARGRAILTAPEHVAEKEIREAALEPTMNRQVWQRYGPNVGSDKTFIWNLVSEMGFSDTGAKEFAKQYRATIQYAGLADVPPDTVEDDESLAAEIDDTGAEGWVQNDLAVGLRDRNELMHGPVGTNPVATTPVAPTVDVWLDAHGRRIEVDRHHPPTSARISRHAIPLVGGKQVILEGEFPLTEAAWKGFLVVLEAFKPGLVEQEEQSRTMRVDTVYLDDSSGGPTTTVRGAPTVED